MEQRLPRLLALPFPRKLSAMTWGALLSLALLGSGLALAPGEGRGRLNALVNWDANWYVSICRDGYHTTLPPVAQAPDRSNVGFFPGYPMLCRALHRAHPAWDPAGILLALSFLATWGFWTLFLQHLERRRIPSEDRWVYVGLVATFPSSFFLVLPYSESLFLYCSTLYLLGVGSSRVGLTSVAGALMGATRIFGLALAPLPLLALARRGSGRLGNLGIPMVAGVAGGVFFFGWCALRFGEWDLYLQAQKIGWGIRPQVQALFNPDRWLLIQSVRYGPLNALLSDSDVLSRWMTIAFSWMGVGALAYHGLRFRSLPPSDRRRAGLFLLAALTLAAGYYIAMGGGSCRSMVRYLLAPSVWMLLWMSHYHTTWSEVHRVLFRNLAYLVIAWNTFWWFTLFQRFLEGTSWVA